MTEDTLEHLPIDALLDLMMESTKELLAAREKYGKNEIEINVKKEQVGLLQRVIITRRLEFPPG